jgi:hypothetical protein
LQDHKDKTGLLVESILEICNQGKDQDLKFKKEDFQLRFIKNIEDLLKVKIVGHSSVKFVILKNKDKIILKFIEKLKNSNKYNESIKIFLI